MRVGPFEPVHSSCGRSQQSGVGRLGVESDPAYWHIFSDCCVGGDTTCVAHLYWLQFWARLTVDRFGRFGVYLEDACSFRINNLVCFTAAGIPRYTVDPPGAGLRPATALWSLGAAVALAALCLARDPLSSLRASLLHTPCGRLHAFVPATACCSCKRPIKSDAPPFPELSESGAATALDRLWIWLTWDVTTSSRGYAAVFILCLAGLALCFASAYTWFSHESFAYGQGGSVHRAAGFALLVCLGLLLLPVTRFSVWLHVLGVPFERALRLHRWLGGVAVILTLWHGIGELQFGRSWAFLVCIRHADFDRISCSLQVRRWSLLAHNSALSISSCGQIWTQSIRCRDFSQVRGRHACMSPLSYFLISAFPMLAGVCILIIAVASSEPVRRRCYEAVVIAHFLWPAVVGLVIAHCWGCFSPPAPLLVPPAALLLLDFAVLAADLWLRPVHVLATGVLSDRPYVEGWHRTVYVVASKRGRWHWVDVLWPFTFVPGQWIYVVVPQVKYGR
jgi:hypothetical protein